MFHAEARNLIYMVGAYSVSRVVASEPWKI